MLNNILSIDSSILIQNLMEKNRLLEERNKIYLMNISELLKEITIISSNQRRDHRNFCLTDKYGLGKIFDFVIIENNKNIDIKLSWISYNNIIFLKSTSHILTKNNINITEDNIPYGTTNLRWNEEYKLWLVDIDNS